MNPEGGDPPVTPSRLMVDVSGVIARHGLSATWQWTHEQGLGLSLRVALRALAEADVRGHLQPDVVEQFEWPPNRALFLDDVRVELAFRRKGYASLLVADALLTLATHGTAVFAHPGPTDLGPGREDDVARFRSETQNTRFLGALGFTPFRDRLWILDLATEDANERLAAIRRREAG